MEEYTAFEYRYRDAGNYKANGWIPLAGSVGTEEMAAIARSLIDGACFVAEDVGIPTLYHQLWEFSGGANADDHGFHEFVGFRALRVDEVLPGESCIPVGLLVQRFSDAAKRWGMRL